MTVETIERRLDNVLDAMEAAYGHLSDVASLDRSSGTFTIGSPGVPATDLADLVKAITGGNGAIPHWVPNGLHLDELIVARLGDGFGVAGRLIAYGQFQVIDGLEIDSAQIDIEYRDGQFFANIAGAALLNDIDMKLDVALELPSETFMIKLKSDGDQPVDKATGHPHDIGIFERLGLPNTGSGPPKLRDLLISGSIPFATYRALVEVDDLVHVPGFEVGRVRALVELGANPTAEVEAIAAITLGDTRIELDLTGGVSRAGWTLEAEAWIDGAPTLGDLINTLITAHSTSAPDIPDEIGGLALQQLGVAIDTEAGTQHFGCLLRWGNEGTTLHVSIDHSSGPLTAAAELRVGDLNFEIAFASSASGSTLVGTYRAAAGSSVSLADILRAFGPPIPGADSLSFDVHAAVIAFAPDTSGEARQLVTADIGLGVDLAALHGVPLVGDLLPSDASIRLILQPIMSTAWSKSQLQGVRTLAPRDMHLPELLTAGPHLSAKLTADGKIIGNIVQLDASADDGAKQADSSTPSASISAQVVAGTTSTPSPTASDFAWHELGRSFGPIHLDRVGLLWQHDNENELAVAIDGRLAVGGLTVALDGLAVHYGIDDHHVNVGLTGLGLDMKEGPIEIGGAFLNRDGDFLGKVLIKTEDFTLSALGAFSMMRGQPSMFIYGILDMPLGGPAFFYVEGLAAGFGYNRSFHPPTVAGIRNFPLVVDAIGGNKVSDPTAQLERLHEFVAPCLGDYFLAAGVKFTSFKLLDSFALLVVRFGNDPEIDVIGTSTYQTPPGNLGGVPAIAHVELNLLARFPLSGEHLIVEARLTNKSYVYASACHISGGFAFASWFSGKHAGDFVLTVGGYHPRFHPEIHKPHYPSAPRLELRYQITDDIYIKGSGYFALTPSVFMAGATVEAVADIGSVHATFRMSIDMLLGWEPYHYEADLSLYIAAKWKSFHTHATAKLAIRGPDFAGHAEVDWAIFSFDVDFGKRHPSGPLPISWDRFNEAFLPEPVDGSSVRCASGLIKTIEIEISEEHDAGTASNHRPATERWIVNAKDLVLTTSSPVPALSGGLPSTPAPTGRPAVGVGIGVAPMDASVSSCTHSITVLRDGINADIDFIATERVGQFPGALWDRSMERGMHDNMISAIAGYSIVPAVSPVTGSKMVMHRNQIEYTPHTAYRVENEPEQLFRDDAQDVIVTPALSTILIDLGFTSADVEVRVDFSDHYPIDGVTIVKEVV
ncbi:DUF6603 domain-containing protein [Cyanobium sp. NS01]|uniref:DUF6603 domain-containing protein n=1 Tax=Cyanobium sp. NS01 TaxID=261284 RepID=UPI001643FDE0|nr:DUF6603 domain-containing protein [Cyanobium sp. NS01]QNI71025.1 hypothetical protein CyaNS01_01896 [Cyanobium sp. NS01]